MSVIKTIAAVAVIAGSGFFVHHASYKSGRNYQRQQDLAVYEQQVIPRVNGMKNDLREMERSYQNAMKKADELEGLLQKFSAENQE